MNGHYYNKLKELIDSGRLSVFIIIAPPRSNSSVLEHVLSLAPEIKNACHEPFLGARKKNYEVDTGYHQIYDSIGGENFENSNDRTSVVIKEMAHWIGAGDEYKNLVTLTNRPVVALIRNPLLTVESRIRRVIKSLNMRPGISLQQNLLDVVARDNGFKNGIEFLSSTRTDIQEILRNLQLIMNDKDLYHEPVLSVQNHLLDYYAKKAGYVDWQNLIEIKLYHEKDYRFFEPILTINTRRVSYEKNEFTKLNEIVQYLKMKEQPYVVIDTTDIRAEPDGQLRELCSKLEISFSPEMIHWGDKPIDFHTQQNQEHEKIWYNKLFSSDGLNPPIEISPTLEMFPDFMQKYLQEVNLPIYAELSQEKKLSAEARQEINGRKFRLEVNEENKNLLHSLGILSDEVTETGVLVELRDIDPVYAVTNEPLLAKNMEFCAKKQRYTKEIDIISNSFSENDEPNRELRSHLKSR